MQSGNVEGATRGTTNDMGAQLTGKQARVRLQFTEETVQFSSLLSFEPFATLR
jgi:hypothetical protein